MKNDTKTRSEIEYWTHNQTKNSILFSNSMASLIFIIGCTFKTDAAQKQKYNLKIG